MNMKKIFIPFVIAATTLSFAACQKEVSSPAIEDELVSLNFTSANPTTKTVADAVNKTILWEKGDKISIAYTVNDNWQNATGDATKDRPAKIYASNGLAAGGETAVFNISGDFNATATGVHQFYSVYPSSCVKSTEIKYAPSVTMSIPDVQTPAENSFDAAADLMIGKATKTYNSLSDARADAIPLLWQRIVSHADITLKGLQGLTENEVITTIVLTADADAKLVGDRWIDIQNGNILGPKTITDANILTINGTNLKVNSNNVEFWAAVMPATVKSLNIVVETNKATYTRNIESCNIEFKQNARKGLNVDMSSVERVEKSAGLVLPFDEDFNAVKSTNNWENLEIAKFPNFSDFKTVRSYQIDGAIIIGTGSAKGSVSTVDINLAKASHVIIRAKKYSKDNVAISMTAGGKTYTTAKLGENFQDYSINLPALSSTEKITITSDITGRLYIDRIQIIEENFAELSVNPEYQSVESSATSTTFNVSSNTKWTVSTTSDWAKVSTPSGENNGEVEITFSENTTDKERTADIVVTTEDDSITKTFKLTQNGVGGAVVVWDDDFSTLTSSSVALSTLKGSKTGFKDEYTIANCYPEDSSLKISASKKSGSLQTPKFTRLSGTSSVTVTIEYAGYGSDNGTLNLSVVGNGTLSKESLTATNTATSGASVKTWDKATFVISDADKDTALKLASDAKKRFFINSIKIEIN
uniref:BACON domain-containing protein n=1 Tax=Candidatus Cryptobacteroides bacterium TaxID=3085639 RepID=UPI003FEFAA8A